MYATTIGLAAFVAAAPPELAQPQAWLSLARRNCYSSAENGFVGADIVSASTNPVVHVEALHQSLESCQAACIAEPECDGICMQDQVHDQPTCFLRKNIDLTQCDEKFPDFTMWLKPGGKAETTAAASLGLMPTFAGVACPGAEWAGVGALAGKTLPECEDACRAKPACNAVHYQHMPKDSLGRSSTTCHLWRVIGWAGCRHGSGHFELRMVREMGAPALQGAAQAVPQRVSISPKVLEAWATVSSLNCFPGHGGDDLHATGFSPVPGYKTLEDCEALCLMKEECLAIVMRVGVGKTFGNCGLRRAVRMTECQPDPDMALWVKPGEVVYGVGDWVSYSGTNCFEGAGAESASDVVDVLPGHLKLGACERQCDLTEECQAIVFQDGVGADSSNCYLRKNVVPRHCEGDRDFNLRMHAKFSRAYSVLRDATTVELAASRGHAALRFRSLRALGLVASAMLALKTIRRRPLGTSALALRGLDPESCDEHGGD